jgi:hypothetical protein
MVGRGGGELEGFFELSDEALRGPVGIGAGKAGEAFCAGGALDLRWGDEIKLARGGEEVALNWVRMFGRQAGTRVGLRPA